MEFIRGLFKRKEPKPEPPRTTDTCVIWEPVYIDPSQENIIKATGSPSLTGKIRTISGSFNPLSDPTIHYPQLIEEFIEKFGVPAGIVAADIKTNNNRIADNIQTVSPQPPERSMEEVRKSLEKVAKKHQVPIYFVPSETLLDEE